MILLLGCIAAQPLEDERAGKAELFDDDVYEGLPPLPCDELRVYEEGVGNIDFEGVSARGDAEAFCQEYNAVANAVTVRETDWTDLSPLSCLCDVPVDLQISHNAELTSLRGLDHLTRVGFTFYLGDNPALRDLQGLTDVPEMHTIYLWDMEGLQSLDGFPRATRLGELDLRWLPALTDFQAMERWIEIDTSLHLEQLDQFDDLAPLRNLTSVPILTLNELPIRSLEGLDSLNSVPLALQVEECQEFVSVAGLQGGAEIPQINLEELHQLVSLEGFPDDLHLSLLYVDRSGISDLSGLTNLLSLESLAFYGNGSLTSLTGLPAREQFTILTFEDGNALATVEALSGVTQVGELVVWNAGSLPSLDGLQGLRNAGYLSFWYLDGITDLSPLYGLESVDYLSIRESDQITGEECDELQDVIIANGAGDYGDVNCIGAD